MLAATISLRNSRESSFQDLQTLRLDWQSGFSLLKETEISRRKRGIILLTLSDFPIAEEKYSSEILQKLSSVQDEDEITGWVFFLKNVPVESQSLVWQTFLEKILSGSTRYPVDILKAAMKRYVSLTGKADPGIVGDEIALGLPRVVEQKPR